MGPLGGELDQDLSGEIPMLAPARLERVGPYEILHELGRGGTAVVFLGRAEDGDEVAVKVLRPGSASRDFLERFVQERRILTKLGEHPHIARLLDGGSDRKGRPYFVLEYVEGRPIDIYCDEERLDVSARLRLFVKVARAVEHAHGHQVIHRDVKPTNVLVRADGEPKLLDFGISKMLDPEASQVPLTRSGTQLMTPAYATPEQMLGQPPERATDVYQLGLLLYILSCGRFPYRLKKTAAAVAGAIVNSPARPLRSALHEPDLDLPIPYSGGHSAALIAENRGTSVAELEQQLSGDLERIVFASLAKDPRRRYASVADLVADVSCLLRGEPVSAPRVGRSGTGDGDGGRRNAPSGTFEKLGQKLRSFLGDRDDEPGR
jgi:serine/threonine-protein kinase